MTAEEKSELIFAVCEMLSQLKNSAAVTGVSSSLKPPTATKKSRLPYRTKINYL